MSILEYIDICYILYTLYKSVYIYLHHTFFLYIHTYFFKMYHATVFQTSFFSTGSLSIQEKQIDLKVHFRKNAQFVERVFAQAQRCTVRDFGRGFKNPCLGNLGQIFRFFSPGYNLKKKPWKCLKTFEDPNWWVFFKQDG